MYQALYRKYRPSSFDEVVGQKVIVQTLKNAIKNNTLNHAYLFTGPRGTGKTSIAKILARTINCENAINIKPCNNCVNCTQIQSSDIVEIDAASNNGVDEIRELKSKINLVPSLGKYKIYIIDEVHMLTTGAFNALLKTLEEPPSHIIFILATTEPHKIPMTIISRCQRFDFKRLTVSEIYDRLKSVSNQEQIEIENQALLEIAHISDGGMRDALGLLNQAISYADGKIELDDIHEINGTVSPIHLKKFIQLLINNDINNLFMLSDEFEIKGKSFVKLSEEIILFLKNLLLSKKVPTYFKSSELDNLYKDIEFNENKVISYIDLLMQAIHEMHFSTAPKLLFEIAILKMIDDPENIQLKTNIEKQKKTNFSNISDTFTDNTSKEEIKLNDNINKFSSDSLIIIKLKSIRVNNTLSKLNKEYIRYWQKELTKINDFLLDPIYGDCASLVIDGKIKAASEENIIFVYENSHLANLFNGKLFLIEELLEKIYLKNVKIIATDVDEWEKIKIEFNSKKKKYCYIHEDDNLLNQLRCENTKENIDTLFGDIIEYEK